MHRPAGVTVSGPQGLAKVGVAPPIWRRLFHVIFGSSVPVAGIFAPWGWIVIAAGILAAGGLALDLARFRLSWLNRQFTHWLWPLLRREEDRRFTGATYMLVAAFIAFLFFDRDVAIPALLFLSLGDPAASLVGARMPGPRLFAKSPGGTVAFVTVALLVVAVLVSTDAVEYHWGLLLGAAIAGLVELAPLRLDDNLTIPLLSGTAMQVLGVSG